MALKWKKGLIGKEIEQEIGRVYFVIDGVEEEVNIIYCNDEIVWANIRPYENDIFKFYLNDNDNTCAIAAKDVDNLPEELQIPEYCEVPLEAGGAKKYIVTSILPSGFFEAENIISVTIPESVINIGYKAFRKCLNLTKVHFLGTNPKLSAIGEEAFRRCKNLTQINLSDTNRLEYIGRHAFAKCRALSHIEIPSSVEELDNGAFRWCMDLRTVTFTTTDDDNGNLRGIKRIGARAFSLCWELQDIYLPATIIEIGFNAFNGCNTEIFCNFSKEHGNFGTGWQLDISNIIRFDVQTPWTFEELDDGTYKIIDCITSCLAGEVTLPSTYNGQNVTEIDAGVFYQVEHLTKVTIPNTIRKIHSNQSIDLLEDGEYGAFEDCINLTEVIFEENSTLAEIGKRAFKNCIRLENINIPDSVKEIKDEAFYACSSITKITFPRGVESIGKQAFCECEELYYVEIPETVIYIGAKAFYGCVNLNYINCNLAEQPDNWDSAFDKKSNSAEFTVFWAIMDEAASANSIQITVWGETGTVQGFYGNIDNPPNALEIPAETNKGYPVTTIADKAFKEETSLMGVVIPESVIIVGKEAFRECENLSKVFIDAREMAAIGNQAFYYCKMLDTIEMPFWLGSIGNSIFAGCESLLKIDIPEGIREIPSHAFDGCKSLSTVNIFATDIKNIGESAFSGCESLTTITIPEGVTSIGDYAFLNCTGLTNITIPDSVTSIGEGAFEGCTGLQSITFGSSVTSVGKRAFSGCTSLTSVTIPTNVTSIGAKAFQGCSSLSSVTFEDVENSKLERIHDKAFAGCPLTEVTLPSGIKIDKDSFDEIDVVTNETKNKFFWDVFTGTLTVAFANTTIPNFLSAIGVGAFAGRKLRKLVIPENITTIMTAAFFKCLDLEEIFIPSTVKYIRANAFEGCAKDKLTIKCAARKKPDTWDDDWNPDGCAVVWGCVDGTASDELFTYTLLADGTYSIKAKDEASLPSRLVIPTSYQGIPVTTIAANGFSGREVIWVDVLSGIKTIEYGAFKNCSMLLDINFPETLEYIGADAFYGCENLELIQLPDSIKTIETWAFRDCDKAKNIYIPNGVEMINNGAFIGVNVDERTIWCENTAAEISAKGWNAAWNAKDITGITKFPVTYNAAAVTDSSKFEFRTTTDGNYYVKPASSSIAREMVVVHVPSSYNGIPVTEIGSFADCKNLVKMILPDSITRLRVEAFGGDRYEETSGCTNLNEINLPNSLKWIGDGAFLGSSITNLVIPEGVEQSTLSNVFMNCRQLRHITLPESWTEIGQEMFKGCTNLTDIVLPTKCNSIGSNAFLDCENLQNVYLYNKHWNVGDAVLDLTDKSVAEVAQLLTNAEYSNVDWSIVKPNVPVLHNELDEHFVEFTVENPNNTPQILTVSLTLKDGSSDSIEEIYSYSETYTIGANQSITEIFDMPLTEDHSGLMAFNYAELVAYFENSDEIKLILTNNNEVCEQNGHTYIDTVIAPTCTTRGYTRHECKVCGQSYDDSYVEATGHTYTSNTIEATCTTSGYTEYTCSVCGHYYVDDYVSALGHTWGDWVVDTPATCTTTGWKKRTCSVCGYSVVEFIPTTSHTWIDATCTTPKTCSVCGATEGYALGHTSSDWIIDVEPTDTTEGSKHKECIVCGQVLQTASIIKLGYFTFTELDDDTYSIKAADTSNLPSEIEIPSTYNGKDVTVIEDNAFAGASFTSVTIPSTIKSIGTGAFSNNTAIKTIDIPLGVEYIGANAFSGTDTLWVFCEVYEQPDTWDENWATDVYVIKWHFKCLTDGHKYEEIVVAPTCTEQGYNGHTCSVCGRSYVDSYIEALGHNWSDWNITLEPTCTETGTRRRDCTRCDVYETETISALGHDWGAWEDIHPAECEIDGTQERTCARCGEKETRTIPATGHDWDTEVEIVEPTCTEQGYTIHKCNNCGATYKDNFVDALGHISSDWIIDVEATTETEGSKHKECTRCGVVLETATIPKLGDINIYLVTESGNNLTDEQGNLLII